MRKSGLGWVLAAGGLLAMASPACASKKSGLMLAVTTDMKAPKDVNAVGVTISTNNVVKYSTIGRVTPDGDILLPATLAIAEPDDPNATVRIRVVAFQEQKARVLRDVRTSIPPGGLVSLLRIPLTFVNDGSVTAQISADALPAKKNGSSTAGQTGAGNSDPAQVMLFTPNCPNPEHTWINGECADAFVDFNTLPPFREELVGAGDKKDKCFDVAQCFATATPVGEGGAVTEPPATPAGAVDAGPGSDGPPGGSRPQDVRPANITLDRASCSVKLTTENAAQINLALVTPDTGECIRPRECFVPLDSGEGGWKAEGGQIKLPAFVCRLLKQQTIKLYASQSCRSKTESNPVCAELVGGPASPEDDGGPATPRDADVVTPQGDLVVAIDYPTSVVATQGGTLVAAGANKIVGVMPGSPTVQPLSGVTASAGAWWFDRAPLGEVYLSNEGAQAYHLMGTAFQSISVANVRAATRVDAFEYFATAQGLFRTGGVEPVLMQAGDMTTVAGLDLLVIAGDRFGHVGVCDMKASACGSPVLLSDGARIDGVASSPGGPSAYLLTSKGLYRTGIALGPSPQISGAVNVTAGKPDTNGVTNDATGYLRRGVASDGVCVYYTSDAGLMWRRHDGSTEGVLVAQTTDPLLGIALAPRPSAGGGQAVYYALHAAEAQGGGIHWAPVPSQCVGGSIPGPFDAGGGKGDASGSIFDAGLDADAEAGTDASPPPPADAGAPTCIGKPCAAPIDCPCSGKCVSPDGGASNKVCAP